MDQNSFLMKVNKLSTKKKVLKTNLKDVLIAEQQENNKEETETTTVVEIGIN